MSALSKIRHAGFALKLIGDSIEVKPANNLTGQQIDFLKSHKAELIAELRAEQAVNDVYHKIVTCYTPSGIPIDVNAKDAEHSAFLARMNPQLLKKETTHD